MPAMTEDPAVLFELAAQRLEAAGDAEAAQLARLIDPDVFEEKLRAQQQLEPELTY